MDLSACFHRNYSQVLQVRPQRWHYSNGSIYSNTSSIKYVSAQLWLLTASDMSTTNNYHCQRHIYASGNMKDTHVNSSCVIETSCKNKPDKNLLNSLLLRCLPTAACCSQIVAKDGVPNCVSDTSCKNKPDKSLLYGLLLGCLPAAACSSQKIASHSDPHVSDVEGEEGEGLPGVLQKRSSRQNHSTHISEQELSQWLEKETGIDRLRLMYTLGPDGAFVHQDTRDLMTMWYRTVGLGAAVSVALAYFQQRSEKQKLITNMQPLLQGSFKKKLRWKSILAESGKNTLKYAVATGLIIHLSQAIAAYRNKSSVWEYAVSSSLGVGVLNLGHNLKHCAKMSLFGAVVGTVGGYVVCKFLDGSGVNQERKHLGWLRHQWREQKHTKQTFE